MLRTLISSLTFQSKIVIGGILLAVLATSFFFYRRSLINQGKAEGRIESFRILEETYGVEWEARLASIDRDRAELEQQAEDLTVERTQLLALRSQLRSDLNVNLERLRKEALNYGQVVANVPAGTLPDSIRGILAELRSIDRGGTSRNPAEVTGAEGSEGEGGSARTIHLARRSE